MLVLQQPQLQQHQSLLVHVLALVLMSTRCGTCCTMGRQTRRGRRQSDPKFATVSQIMFDCGESGMPPHTHSSRADPVYSKKGQHSMSRADRYKNMLRMVAHTHKREKELDLADDAVRAQQPRHCTTFCD